LAALIGELRMTRFPQVFVCVCASAGHASARNVSRPGARAPGPRAIERARPASLCVRARYRVCARVFVCVCVCRNAGWRDRVRVYGVYVWACAGAGALPFSRRVRGRVLLVGLIRRLCVCVCTRRQVNWSSAYSRKPSASSVFWVSRSVRWALPRALAGWRGSSSSIL